MAQRRRSSGSRTGTETQRPIPETPPLPAEPIDLLAGLAPDIELEVDPCPPGIASAEDGGPQATTVAVTGRLLRSGDATIRRLIRTPLIEPAPSGDAVRKGDVERAGVLPRSPDKPGE